MFFIILNQCILKKNNSFLNKHAKIFVPYRTKCEHQLDYSSRDEDKPIGVATINHPTQVENHKIKNLKELVIIFMKSIN